MIAEGGRKYTLSILGIGCIVGLTVAGFVAAIIRADLATLAGAILPVSIGAIAGVVATFITGNSAVTFAYAKSDMTQTAIQRTGTEPDLFTDDER